MESPFCKHEIVIQTDDLQHRHVLPRAPQVVLCCALSQFAFFFLLSGHCIDIALLTKSNLK
jgi:hypothetical protein